MSFLQILAAAFALLIVVITVCVWGYAQRRKHLLARYGDAETVRRILKRELWQGETREQLLASLGKPADTDETVLKTKTKEVWKYRPFGRNRFGLKVTLDDGIVVAWAMTD